jgi:hypothetical protein
MVRFFSGLLDVTGGRFLLMTSAATHSRWPLRQPSWIWFTEFFIGTFCETLTNLTLVLLLCIFRRAPLPSDTRGALVPFYFPGGALSLKKNYLKKNLLVIYDTSSIREPPKVS